MTDTQRELARHALGLDSRHHTSHRNRFVTGKDTADHAPWTAMVAAGEAWVFPDLKGFGGMDYFVLTLKGALEARGPKDHLSREDTAVMRKRDEVMMRRNTVVGS